MAKLNIKPLADRVLIEPMAAETKTASGIIIPDTAKEKPQKGKVVAVGPGTHPGVGPDPGARSDPRSATHDSGHRGPADGSGGLGA